MLDKRRRRGLWGRRGKEIVAPSLCLGNVLESIAAIVVPVPAVVVPVTTVDAVATAVVVLVSPTPS